MRNIVIWMALLSINHTLQSQNQSIILGPENQGVGKENAVLKVLASANTNANFEDRVGIYARANHVRCDETAPFTCYNFGIGGFFEGNVGVRGEGINYGVVGIGEISAVEAMSESGTGVKATSDNGIGLWVQSFSSHAIYSQAQRDEPAFTGHGQFQIGNATFVSGDYAIAMGTRVHASGDNSIAIGNQINTNNQRGAMILADSDPNGEGETLSGINDQLVARFYNGYWFMTSGDNVRTGIQATHGSNAWSSICDVRRKENFQYLNDTEVLNKLASIDYSSWNYKGQDPRTFRHYGIMAQDFYRLFGKDDFGTIGTDTLVNPIDMMGIAMSAIKGAKKEIDQANEEIRKLKQYILSLEKEKKEVNTKIERMMAEVYALKESQSKRLK